jgi:hypothetical protein
MATSPDAKVIERESLKTSLEARYSAKQKAGGTFDAYKSNAATPGNMLEGLQGSMGYTQKSRVWTTEPGFKTGGGNGNSENFNDKALNYADTLPGFNTKRYFR